MFVQLGLQSFVEANWVINHYFTCLWPCWPFPGFYYLRNILANSCILLLRVVKAKLCVCVYVSAHWDVRGTESDESVILSESEGSGPSKKPKWGQDGPILKLFLVVQTSTSLTMACCLLLRPEGSTGQVQCVGDTETKTPIVLAL